MRVDALCQRAQAGHHAGQGQRLKRAVLRNDLRQRGRAQSARDFFQAVRVGFVGYGHVHAIAAQRGRDGLAHFARQALDDVGA